jgi:rSAM/selenodomain-associated transferase 2
VTVRIAVVVPTLNEEAFLPRLLASLAAQSESFDEIAVADGGSTDRTIEIAEAAGAKVVRCERGRGLQIAAGIQATTAEVILVLHADSQASPQTSTALRRWFAENPKSPGGSLGHRFDGGGWLLRWVEWADERRARRGISYGDQGQFFRRDILPRIGGFPAIPLMEDLELSRRMKSVGDPAYLNLPVLSSTRGFERLGVIRTALRNLRLRKAFERRGVDGVQDLAAEYYA